MAPSTAGRTPPAVRGSLAATARTAMCAVFAAGAREFSPVRIQLSGCRAVAGIGPTRSWSRSPGFGQLLTGTVGGKGRMLPGMHPSSVPTA